MFLEVMVLIGTCFALGLWWLQRYRLAWPKTTYLRLHQHLPHIDETVRHPDGRLTWVVALSGSPTLQEIAIRQGLQAVGVTVQAWSIRRSTETEPPADHDHPVIDHIDAVWAEHIGQAMTVEHVLFLTHTEAAVLKAAWALIETRWPALGPRRLQASEAYAAYHQLISGEVESTPSWPSPYTLGCDVTITPGQVQPGHLGGYVVLGSESEVDETFFQQVLSLPQALAIQHLMAPITPERALWQLSRQSKQVRDGSRYDWARHQVQSGSTCLRWQAIIWLPGDGLALERLAARCGFRLRRLGRDIERAWLSRFTDEWLYPLRIMDQHLAPLLPWLSSPVGLRCSDHAPRPVRWFKTAQLHTRYAFQFHVSAAPQAVGHTLIIGGTGAGKTTLLQHLLTGASGTRQVLLDYLQGMRVMTECIGGTYAIPLKEPMSLNPWYGAGDLAHQSMLRRWLICLTGEPHLELIDLMLALPLEQRQWLNEIDGLTHDEDLKAQLRSCGDLFTGLDTWSNRRVVGFDVSELMNHSQALSLFLIIVMARIQREAMTAQHGHLVVVDEAAKLLESPRMAEVFKEWVLQQRKLRGVVVFCFQNPQDVPEWLWPQCPTRLIFPNEQAIMDHHAPLELTEAEAQGIQGELRLPPRSVLLKKPGESVWLDVDVSCLRGALRCYGSSATAVQQMQTLQQAGKERWWSCYLAS